MVRPKGFPARRDVSNRLGGQVLDRAFGRPLAVDQLIIRHPLGCQLVAHKPVVLGRNPQTKPVARPKGGGDGV